MPDAQAACCITIGNFDGVHLGHQSLVQLAKKTARDKGLILNLITFWPHPRSVLKGADWHLPLTRREMRRNLLNSLGIDTIIELPFTPELAHLSPEEFITRHLLPLGMKELVIGHDFSLGRNREGNGACLVELGRRLGFETLQAPAFMLENVPVSSTRLRQAITAGNVQGAAAMLGRPYQLQGYVGHGFGRGRTLGFPTANVEGCATLLPARGVYATWAEVNGHLFKAVTNIGQNPTFDGQKLTVEAHILGDCPDLYDQPIELKFVARLRGEIKFASPEALIRQIETDAANAAQLLPDSHA